MGSSSPLDGLTGAMGSLPASTDESDRLAYCRDLWPRHHIGVRGGVLPETRPAGVVWPRTTEEVAEVVAHCQREGVPLVPFGAGSGVCGGVAPDDRTVVMDLKRMARVRALAPDEGSVTVEAGALGIRFEEDLQARGLTLGHFPSSILCSTVGGWIAARSAGQCSGRYGKIEDMVAELECVVGSGEVVTLKRRMTGPDLTPLIVGSEGVLGVVTAAKLRVCKNPDERAYASFTFPDVESGYEAIRAIYQSGLRPAVCRLYDAFDSFMAKRGRVKAARASSAAPQEAEATPSRGTGWLPGAGARALRTLLNRPSLLNEVIDRAGDRLFGGAMLVLIFEASADENRQDVEAARTICRTLRGRDDGEEPARHWLKHRYGVSYRQAPMFMMGAFTDTMEVAAPWSKLGDLYRGVRHALGRSVFVMAHLSHAYPDGCSIYFTFAGSAKSASEAQAKYDATWRAAMDAALAAGGTLSHHHGVGRSKAPKLGKELGAGIDAIDRIRRFIDPGGIFNPGNLLPRERGEVTIPPLCEAVDETSRLLRVGADTPLGRAEEMASRASLTLAIHHADPKQTIGEWLAAGGPGSRDRWLDPVDQPVAGFAAELPSKRRMWIRPAPRRAVGPDLLCLYWGQRERVGKLVWADLRLVGGDEARSIPCSLARDPAPSAAETAFIDGVLHSLHDV